MYTITFYSFKGGVGRSLALVNVAASLVNQGRTVGLIDFDLEAPGLSTFDLLSPPSNTHPGVVEYISEYMQTGKAPDLDRFVYPAPLAARPGVGKLFVMPAGREDGAYRRSLANLDWAVLYDRQDGFLFLEDTKRQFETRFQVDYLLVDSRTGHTDVEGICTRQLPDAVVIMFFPNQQNLAGLKSVCRSIRDERTSGLHKDITLHFVMSNVPDLDDEDAILRRRIRSFRRELQFQQLTATIHRYESLALLNQSIFVIDRPRSRLSRQYRRLVGELAKSNPADRMGALKFLEERHRGALSNSETSSSVERRIQQILQHFSYDADVLTALARIKTDDGSLEQAILHLDQALAVNADHAEARIQRAYCRQRLGQFEQSTADLIHCCLHIPDIDPVLFIRAFRGLVPLAPERLAEIVRSPAILALGRDTRGLVISELSTHDSAWTLALELMPSHVSTLADGSEELKKWETDWVLLLIRAGRWDEAISHCNADTDHPDRLSQIVAFNVAMALWGRTGVLRTDLMQTVLDKESSCTMDPDPNHEQCLSLVMWSLGFASEAIARIQGAISMATSASRRIFSCWRYAPVSSSQFREDCEHFVQMFSGKPILPPFLRRTDAPVVELPEV